MTICPYPWPCDRPAIGTSCVLYGNRIEGKGVESLIRYAGWVGSAVGGVVEKQRRENEGQGGDGELGIGIGIGNIWIGLWVAKCQLPRIFKNTVPLILDPRSEIRDPTVSRGEERGVE